MLTEAFLNTAELKLKSSSSLTRGYLICIGATFLWSSTGIFIRYLTEAYRLPPLVLAFWRDLIVAVFLFVALRVISPRRLGVERRHLRFLFFYGIELSLFNSLWTISVALNGAAVATVLAYSSAAFTALLGWRLLAERLNPLKITAVALSLMGCVFVSGAHTASAWSSNTLGILTGLLSGMAFAGYSLMGKAASQRALDPWTTLLYSFAFAVPFLFTYNLFPAWLPEGVASLNFLWLGASLGGWAILAFLAVGPTVGGFGFYIVSLTYLPASVANLIATLEPVITTVLAYLFLGERLSLVQLLGSVLIITGVITLRLSQDRHR
jgi:drug/metabolite transporter (DMT)-like permease